MQSHKSSYRLIQGNSFSPILKKKYINYHVDHSHLIDLVKLFTAVTPENLIRINITVVSMRIGKITAAIQPIKCKGKTHIISLVIVHSSDCIICLDLCQNHEECINAAKTTKCTKYPFWYTVLHQTCKLHKHSSYCRYM